MQTTHNIQIDNRITPPSQNRRAYTLQPTIQDSISTLFGTETGIALFDDHDTNYLELHVYDLNDNLIASGYDIPAWDIITQTTPMQQVLGVDIHNNIRELGLYSGRYNYTYKFLKELISKPIYDILRVDEISSTRKEVRIALSPNASIENLDKFNNIPNIIRWDDSSKKRNLLINFGKNRLNTAISWKKDVWTYEWADNQHVIVFKLKQTVPEEIQVGDTVSIAYELAEEIKDSILLIPANPGKLLTVLAPPNFNAKTNNINQRKETGYENWDRLVGTQTNTSNQIINKYFSGSRVDLNVDYTTFDNFIFYSSAEKRIENFKYKLQQIEVYDGTITTLMSAASASVTSSDIHQANVNSYREKRNTIIGSFDGFENYMYYQSSSYVSNSLGIYESRTWPKSNSSPPYILYSYSSSTATDWYDNVISSASFFDRNNVNALKHAVPAHIQDDEYSEQYITFVDLVAHHFDLIWLYIKNSLSILDRDESVYNGLSKDLVYYALNSMGWGAEDDHQFDELWEYLLGTNVSGSTPIPGNLIDLQPSQSLVYVTSQSISTKDVNKEIWKRLLNNLPYILKTKGTEKGIQALLNIYGIPSTILRIREYGGPEPSTAISQYRYDKFNYAVDINGHNSILVPKYRLQQTNRSPDAIEFRFKTVNGYEYDFIPSENSWSYQSLLRTDEGDMSFNIERLNTIYGDLVMTWAYYSASVMYEGRNTIISGSTVFDGNWWSVLINKRSGSDDILNDQYLDVYLKQTNYAELTHEYSGSMRFNDLYPASASVQNGIKNIFYTSSLWRLGGGAAGPTGSMSGSSQSYLKLYPFTGSMQEFRYWARSLGESAFDNHVTAPLAHNYTYATGSYDNLAMRLALGSDLHITQSNIDYSIHPNQNISTFANGIAISASYIDYTIPGTSSLNYFNNVEEYSIDWPDLSGNRSISNKVRIDDNELLGDLNVYRSREVSAYDLYPLDSPKLGVYFSPTNEVNENIAEFLGGFNIDNYIGDYDSLFENNYSALEDLRRYYFKQYDGQYNVIDYIRLVQYFDQSIWRQIKKLSPARAALDTGLVIEPHILNRSKVKLLGSQPTITDLQLTCSIDLESPVTWSGGNNLLDVEINAEINITASASDETLMLSAEINQFPLIEITGDDVIYAVSGTINDFNEDITIEASMDDPDDYSAELVNIEALRTGAPLSQDRTVLLNYIDQSGVLVWFTSSGDLMYSQDIQPVISQSRSSNTYMYQTVSESIVGGNNRFNRTYYPADIQDALPIGTQNQRWLGCKISAPDFNVPSLDTPDGGPVIEYYRANPNVITVNPSLGFNFNDPAAGTPSNLAVD